MKKDKHITLSTLKDRGWTASLIRDFLGKHDTEKPNPMFRSSPPMKLFALKRVQKQESTPEFKEAFEKAKKRSKTSRKARIKVVSKKRQELQDKINKMKIRVPGMSYEKLERKAIKHYNDWEEMKSRTRGNYGEISWADSDSDKFFLQRISVNYLRHELTSYEDKLNALARKIGRRDGYVSIKKKVLEAIASQYPELSGECDRQIKDVEKERDIPRA